MAVDTSSSAAARIPVVWAAAAVWAALRSEPMVAKSVAAEVIIAGAAITDDIVDLPLANPSRLSAARLFKRLSVLLEVLLVARRYR
jgi:hypothetical protein